MKTVRKFAVAFVVGMVAFGALAMGQEPPAVVDNTVDFAPAIDSTITVVFGAVAILLSGLFAFGMRYLNAKTGMANATMQAAAQKIFDSQLANMMSAAESVAKDAIPKNGKFEIDNPFLREAAKFALVHYPDTIGKLKLETIASSILARLPSGELAAKAADLREANAAAAPAP